MSAALGADSGWGILPRVRPDACVLWRFAEVLVGVVENIVVFSQQTGRRERLSGKRR